MSTLKPIAGFDKAEFFLARCLKPEEISGEERHNRIKELMYWFERYYGGNANPKWLSGHLAELCFYIITQPLFVTVVPEPITADYIFRRIAHGDEKHRTWLKEELDHIFAEHKRQGA